MTYTHIIHYVSSQVIGSLMAYVLNLFVGIILGWNRNHILYRYDFIHIFVLNILKTSKCHLVRLVCVHI